MKRIVVMESDSYTRLGLENLFIKYGFHMSFVLSLKNLEEHLFNNSVDMVVMELYTSYDSIYECMEFSRLFSDRWPCKKLVIYTKENMDVLMQFIARWDGNVNVILKSESLQRLTNSVLSHWSEFGLMHNPPVTNQWRILGRGVGLTIREWEVLYLLAKGYSIMRIAHSFCRSYKTINHIKLNAMRKMGCDNKVLFFKKLVEINNVKPTSLQYDATCGNESRKTS